MLPKIAYPTAILWLLALVLAIANPGTIHLTITHHTYTGVLFLLALFFTIWLFVVARSKERK